MSSEWSSPAFAIVSAGEANSYGHPNPEVLERLNRRHIQLFRTDRSGQVTVSTDGRYLQIATPEQTSSSFGTGWTSILQNGQ